ncbi:MAG TPA: CPBP family glutamic-type intramembrane protease [Candidatus Babeliales bacterium]|nr:CPBP family glutamic-type intramembrane protease [Candidatus Babeliales bacterium]
MNKKLFLMLISIPGIISLLPKLTQAYEGIIALAEYQNLSYEKFIIAALVQTALLVLGSVFLGSWATQKIGWYDPILDGIENNNMQQIKQGIVTSVIPSLQYIIPAALLFIVMIHLFLFPWLDANVLAQINDFSLPILMTRIFYGGIVEEIMLRWAILSLFVAIGFKIFASDRQAAWWAAIIIAAFVFGGGHLPNYLATTNDPTVSQMLLIIKANMIPGIFFGWIFKRFGLIAAMVAHTMFHCIWFAVVLVLALIK